MPSQKRGNSSDHSFPKQKNSTYSVDLPLPPYRTNDGAKGVILRRGVPCMRLPSHTSSRPSLSGRLGRFAPSLFKVCVLGFWLLLPPNGEAVKVRQATVLPWRVLFFTLLFLFFLCFYSFVAFFYYFLNLLFRLFFFILLFYSNLFNFFQRE